jgi:cell division protein FtsI (penicillin-binding protein 3)
MNVKKDILWRVYLAFFLVTILAGAILFKMAKLQTVQRSELAKLSDSMSTKWDSISPIRGNIYACDGSLLATSIPIYEAHIDTKAIADTVVKSNIDP